MSYYDDVIEACALPNQQRRDAWDGVVMAVKLTTFHTQECAKYVSLTAYHTQEVVDNIREYIRKPKKVKCEIFS